MLKCYHILRFHNPVSTRRRSDVYTTFYRKQKRCYNVKTTSFVYWEVKSSVHHFGFHVKTFKISPLYTSNKFQTSLCMTVAKYVGNGLQAVFIRRKSFKEQLPEIYLVNMPKTSYLIMEVCSIDGNGHSERLPRSASTLFRLRVVNQLKSTPYLKKSKEINNKINKIKQKSRHSTHLHIKRKQYSIRYQNYSHIIILP